MRKVKLNKMQANAVDKLREEWKYCKIVKSHAHGIKWINEYNSLNTVSLDDLIKAIYVGYEKMVEAREGDWVITEGYSSLYDGKVLRINLVTKDGACYFDGSEHPSHNFFMEHIKRKATELEIQEEKERVKWCEEGRGYWELRNGDLLIDEFNVVSEVIKIVGKRIIFLRLEGNNMYSQHIKGVKITKRVLCFQENRFDKEEGESE